MTTTLEFGDLQITLTEKYSVSRLKSFIDDVTSTRDSTAKYQENPRETLSDLGILINGDIELSRDKLMKALGKNGLPGENGDPQALIGPAIIFIVIVLYPR